MIKKASKKLVSLLHWPIRVSWLENGKKYLSTSYHANYLKGWLPSEDWLKGTKGKHSTICSSQNILALSESSCKCFPKVSCFRSSLNNSLLLPDKEIILWERTVVAMSLCGFNFTLFLSPPQKCPSCTATELCAVPKPWTAVVSTVGSRNLALVQVSKSR